MEIRIGVVDSPKEINLEMTEGVNEVIKRIDTALKAGDAVLWLTDNNGKRVGVQPAKIAYVELDPDSGPRAVGFTP